MTKDFKYAVDADGIATITWDMPDKTMNVMSREGFIQFDGMVDKALVDDAVKGIIITSAKKDFAGGMDLNVFGKIRADSGDDAAEGFFGFVMDPHRIFRNL